MKMTPGCSGSRGAIRGALLIALALAAFGGAARAATHTLKVKVTDKQGRALPLADVEVRVGRGSPSRFWAGSDGVVPVKVPAGSYRLTARAGGHLPGTLNVRVPQQKSVQISLRSYLKSGMGAVTFQVLGDGGKPLVGATVQFVGPGGAVQRSANTDPYALTDIPAGSYKYAVYALGYQERRGLLTVPRGLTSLVVKLAKVRPAGSCRATLNFFDESTGKPLDGVELTYGQGGNTHRSKAIVNRSTTVGPHKPGIYWTRVWKQGYKKTQPYFHLEGASMSRDVYLAPETNKNVFIYLTCKDARSGAPVRTTVTIKGPGINKTAATSGNMSVFGTGQEGTWLVTASAPGYAPYSEQVKVVKRGPGIHLTVSLQKGSAGTLAGAKKHYATFVFTDARSKARLSAVSYVITGPGTSLRGTANGSVKIGPLAAGMHVFSFQRAGYQKAEMRSNVGSSGTIPVTMVKTGDSIAVAAPKNMLAITPMPSTGGNPLSGAQVIVQGPSGRKIKTLSRENAAVVFYDLKPGTYTYTVTASGYSTLTGRIKMGSASRETKILKLKPGALVVSVLVVDEGNTPVSGAKVQAMGPGGKREQTTTNRAGQARLRLFTGVWGVTASEKTLQAASLKVTVPGAGVPRFVLKFPRGGLGFTVVSTAGGHPVPGAGVSVAGSRGNFKGVTDARGLYRLANIPQGTYGYTVTARNYKSRSGRYVLRSTAVMAVPVKLQPSVSNLVVTAVDAKTRKPVAGANVAVRVGSGYERKVTDAAGKVSLSGLKVSSCQVYVSKSGYQQAREVWRSSQGPSLVMSMQRPPLGVQVVDSAGKPIAGATVTTYWVSRSGFLRRRKNRSATVTTDADGRAWPPITSSSSVRNVMAAATGYKSASRGSLRLPANVELRLEKIIPPSQRKATLTVKVVDTRSMRPLSGATVTVASGADRRSATSSSAGLAAIKDLPWGTWRVYVAKPGYTGNSTTQKLDRTGDRTVVLHIIERKPRFIYTVLDSKGKPVAGARVTASWRETPRGMYKRDSAETDVRGQAMLYKLPSYSPKARLTVSKAGLPTISTPVGFSRGNSPYRRTLRFGPAIGTVGNLTVMVSDFKTGARIDGARVVCKAGGRTYYAQSLRSIGKATILNLPLNTTCVYTVSKPGYRTASASVLLKGNRTMAIRLMPATVSLRVTVYGALRRPVPGATVSVFWGDPRTGKTLSRKAVAAANGQASFEDTPTNLPLSLSISARGYKPKLQQAARGSKAVVVQLSR